MLAAINTLQAELHERRGSGGHSREVDGVKERAGFPVLEEGSQGAVLLQRGSAGEDCGGRAATRQGRAGRGGWSRESCSGGREGGAERRCANSGSLAIAARPGGP